LFAKHTLYITPMSLMSANFLHMGNQTGTEEPKDGNPWILLKLQHYNKPMASQLQLKERKHSSCFPGRPWGKRSRGYTSWQFFCFRVWYPSPGSCGILQREHQWLVFPTHSYEWDSFMGLTRKHFVLSMEKDILRSQKNNRSLYNIWMN
jgi:hypothetical protein